MRDYTKTERIYDFNFLTSNSNLDPSISHFATTQSSFRFNLQEMGSASRFAKLIYAGKNAYKKQDKHNKQYFCPSIRRFDLQQKDFAIQLSDSTIERWVSRLGFEIRCAA